MVFSAWEESGTNLFSRPHPPHEHANLNQQLQWDLKSSMDGTTYHSHVLAPVTPQTQGWTYQKQAYLYEQVLLLTAMQNQHGTHAKTSDHTHEHTPHDEHDHAPADSFVGYGHHSRVVLPFFPSTNLGHNPHHHRRPPWRKYK